MSFLILQQAQKLCYRISMTYGFCPASLVSNASTMNPNTIIANPHTRDWRWISKFPIPATSTSSNFINENQEPPILTFERKLYSETRNWINWVVTRKNGQTFQEALDTWFLSFLDFICWTTSSGRNVTSIATGLPLFRVALQLCMYFFNKLFINKRCD